MDFEPLLRKEAAAPKNEKWLEKLKKALEKELFGLAKEVASIARMYIARLLGKPQSPMPPSGGRLCAATGRALNMMNIRNPCDKFHQNEKEKRKREREDKKVRR